MKRGIEEPVNGIKSKCRSIFSAGGPPPEISLSKNKNEQRAEDIKGGDTLFIFAA